MIICFFSLPPKHLPLLFTFSNLLWTVCICPLSLFLVRSPFSVCVSAPVCFLENLLSVCPHASLCVESCCLFLPVCMFIPPACLPTRPPVSRFILKTTLEHQPFLSPHLTPKQTKALQFWQKIRFIIIGLLLLLLLLLCQEQRNISW